MAVFSFVSSSGDVPWSHLGVAVACVLGSAWAGCASSPADGEPVPDRASRQAALRAASTFAVVLSRRAEAEDVDGLSLAILDPDPYGLDDLPAFRQRGVLTLGYVNIGEIEDYRAFADRVDPTWVLGENPFWPGHQFVDARQPGWQRLVTEHVAPQVIARQFDGLFLDMADVAAPGVFPETREGIVAIIQALREAYPTHLIVMNRGLFLLDEVGEDIDGLLVEGVWARYDPATGTYGRTPAPERDRLVAALTDYRERFGGAPLVLDYADRAGLRAFAEAEAAEAGLPIFISTLELADLAPPPHGG
ncbi:MAG: endo alpha-1,4 polygalactosaminidase [Bacteroidota bacterium]